MQCSEDIAAPALVMEGGGLSSVETGAGVQQTAGRVECASQGEGAKNASGLDAAPPIAM